MGPVQVKQVEGSNIVSQDYYAGYTSPLICGSACKIFKLMAINNCSLQLNAYFLCYLLCRGIERI